MLHASFFLIFVFLLFGVIYVLFGVGGLCVAVAVDCDCFVIKYYFGFGCMLFCVCLWLLFGWVDLMVVFGVLFVVCVSLRGVCLCLLVRLCDWFGVLFGMFICVVGLVLCWSWLSFLAGCTVGCFSLLTFDSLADYDLLFCYLILIFVLDCLFCDLRLFGCGVVFGLIAGLVVCEKRSVMLCCGLLLFVCFFGFSGYGWVELTVLVCVYLWFVMFEVCLLLRCLIILVD